MSVEFRNGNEWYSLADTLAMLRQLTVEGIIEYDVATDAVKRLIAKYFNIG